MCLFVCVCVSVFVFVYDCVCVCVCLYDLCACGLRGVCTGASSVCPCARSVVGVCVSVSASVSVCVIVCVRMLRWFGRVSCDPGSLHT